MKSLIIKKKKAHINFKKSKIHKDYLIFSSLRAESKIEMKICFDNYLKKTENAIFEDPKFFWRYLQIKNKNLHFPKHMTYEDKKTDNNFDTANFFKNFFGRVYETFILI